MQFVKPKKSKVHEQRIKNRLGILYICTSHTAEYYKRQMGIAEKKEKSKSLPAMTVYEKINIQKPIIASHRIQHCHLGA